MPNVIMRWNNSFFFFFEDQTTTAIFSFLPISSYWILRGKLSLLRIELPTIHEQSACLNFTYLIWSTGLIKLNFNFFLIKNIRLKNKKVNIPGSEAAAQSASWADETVSSQETSLTARILQPIPFLWREKPPRHRAPRHYDDVCSSTN